MWINSEIEKFQTQVHKAFMPIQRSTYLCMADCSDPEISPKKVFIYFVVVLYLILYIYIYNRWKHVFKDVIIR